MTLEEAITVRRSRRKYLATPIEPETVERLRALARKYSEAGKVRIEPVFNDGSAFEGLRKTYGLLTGVQNYAGLIADKSDALAIERLGYYGELFTLEAVALGLGTCWVGGSFDRKLCPFQLGENEKLACVIAFGPVPEQSSARERFIYSATHRKSKRAEEMMVADAPAPDWFMAGMQAVERAPSAVNRQPVVFTLKGGLVAAGVQDYGAAMDLGIAKLHFEIGAGGGAWAFGNHAAFSPPAAEPA